MRRTLTLFAAALPLIATGCSCSTSTAEDAGTFTDVEIDVADAPVHVNCADPASWAPAPEVEGYFQIGGGPCSPAQYPLHGVTLGAGFPFTERAAIRSSCWRVEEAHDESGWDVGQTFGGPALETDALLQGFGRPVVFSGRLYRADGSLAYSIAPIRVALDDEEFLDVGTEEVVALMHPDVWATRFAVHTSDEVVVTEEVLAASGGTGDSGRFTTLHYQGGEYLVRFWRRDHGLVSTEVRLGEGERAILAQGGGAIAIDENLMLFGNASVSPSLLLPETPLDLVSSYQYTVVRYIDSFSVIFHDAEREGFTIRVAPDPSAKLLETYGGLVTYYASGVYWTLNTALEELVPVESDPATAEIGRPLFIHDNIAITENGFQALHGPTPGPQFLGIGSLVAGSRLLDATAQTNGTRRRQAAYLVQFDDGQQRIYHAPFSSYCE